MLLAQDRTAMPRLDNARIHVLKSKWHSQLVDALVLRFCADIEASGADNHVKVHELSGCLEIPLACIDLHNRFRDEIDLYVCFGILMKGETAHFDMILDTVTAAFAGIIVKHEIAMVNCIIPANSVAEAAARSMDDEFNKGTEAALAAAEIINWRRGIRNRDAAGT